MLILNRVIGIILSCMNVPLLDKMLGMETYTSNFSGIGGRIKVFLDDFIVEEISFDGSIAHVSEDSRYFLGDRDKYLWFVLVKRGIDSISAIRIVARFLGRSYKIFSFAGFKDSRAFTAQFVCARNIFYEDLIKFYDPFGRVFVRILGYRPFKIIPGMLYGNRFRIIVRDIFKDDIDRFFSEVKFFPAYYGYQRFGTIRPNTHIIGKYILMGKFKDAVYELIAHPYPHESENIREIRRIIGERWDFKYGLEIMPRKLSHEYAVLKYLAKHGEDYIGAIRNLPYSIRRLMVSAYQSYIFNKVLSRRILRNISIVYPEVGDIIGILDKNGGIRGIINVNNINIMDCKRLIDEGKAILLLRLLGYSSIIGSGVQGEIEKEVLEEEGISLDIFKSKSMPELGIKGGYRAASFTPENLSYRVDKNILFLSFILKKGFYATVFLRELMKPKNILSAGF